jgi:hypothetical protein
MEEGHVFYTVIIPRGQATLFLSHPNPSTRLAALAAHSSLEFDHARSQTAFMVDKHSHTDGLSSRCWHRAPKTLGICQARVVSLVVPDISGPHPTVFLCASLPLGCLCERPENIAEGKWRDP